MKQIITTSLTLIFVMLAGAVHAGDCMRLCDDNFWKTEPTVEQLQSELNKGADINARGFGGQTPLHYAAIHSTPGHIRHLIEQGADLEAGTADRQSGIGNRTPLHYAVYLSVRKAENTAALIQAGANINARDNTGHTPLMLAVERQQAEVVNILLNAGANARLRDYRKETAFDYARGNPDWIKHLSTYKRLKDASQRQ